MKLRRSELIIISLSLLFVIAAFVQSALPQKLPQTSLDAVYLQSSAYLQAADSAPELGLININTADAKELTLLPGVGEVIAERIITYRSENGGFDNIEEIMNVSGIGEDTFERLKPLIICEEDKA